MSNVDREYEADTLIPPPKDNQFDISMLPYTTPLALYRKLDKYVVGQEKAKRAVARVCATHYRNLRAIYEEKIPIEKWQKNNIALYGPSGSGKTKLIELAARFLRVPVNLDDATGISEVGYAGRNPGSIVKNLLREADGNIDLAEHGIAFIDEIDKKAKVAGYKSIDVSRGSVQHALLRMVEGKKYSWEEGPMKKLVTVDTSKVLFITGGAYEKLDQVIAQRYKNKSKVGFGNRHYSANDLKNITATTTDFINFGMERQFMARFPTIAPLKELDKSQLIEILERVPDSATQTMKTNFLAYGIYLSFDTEAYEVIADKAIKIGTGARSLNAIVEDSLSIFLDYLPSTEKTELCVSKRLIENPKKVLEEIKKKYPVTEKEDEGPTTLPGYPIGQEIDLSSIFDE